MQINSNSGINPNVYLNSSQALARIATGIELNKSSDNASGISIANNLLAQSNGYGQALENANSTIISEVLSITHNDFPKPDEESSTSISVVAVGNGVGVGVCVGVAVGVDFPRLVKLSGSGYLSSSMIAW